MSQAAEWDDPPRGYRALGWVGAIWAGRRQARARIRMSCLLLDGEDGPAPTAILTLADRRLKGGGGAFVHGVCDAVEASTRVQSGATTTTTTIPRCLFCQESKRTESKRERKGREREGGVAGESGTDRTHTVPKQRRRRQAGALLPDQGGQISSDTRRARDMLLACMKFIRVISEPRCDVIFRRYSKTWPTRSRLR